MDQKNANPQGGGPVMDIQAPKVDAAPAAAPQAQAAAPASAEAAKPLKPPKRGKTPLGVIFMAILVAMSLSALTVFAYIKTKDSPPVRSDQQSQNEQRATTGDVDDTTKGIDESLKSMDDTADFNDTDLSDSNLGL